MTKIKYKINTIREAVKRMTLGAHCARLNFKKGKRYCINMRESEGRHAQTGGQGHGEVCEICFSYRRDSCVKIK